ncbi:MAG: stage II sporulation protein R [Oscillospiraceae bacterium]
MKNIKFEISVLLAFIAAIALTQFTTFAKDCNYVRENTVRLHILANSDSEFDQGVKLKIRDEILAQYGEIFSETDNIKNAKILAENKIDEIVNVANNKLIELGYGKKATGLVTNMYFTTRIYDGFKMPAGNYDAIRIIIGEGKGKNWWCVMYPPMCVPTALDRENLTVEEIYKMNDECNFIPKFAIVEWYENFKKNLEEDKKDDKTTKNKYYKILLEKLNVEDNSDIM